MNRNLHGNHRDPREAQAAEEMTRLETPQAVVGQTVAGQIRQQNVIFKFQRTPYFKALSENAK